MALLYAILLGLLLWYIFRKLKVFLEWLFSLESLIITRLSFYKACTIPKPTKVEKQKLNIPELDYNVRLQKEINDLTGD